MVWRGFKKFCAVMCVFCVRQWVLVMKVLLYVVVGAFWCRNYWFYRPHKDFIPSLIQFDSMFLCFGPWILHFGRLPTDLVKTYEGLKQLVLPCHGLKLTDLQSKAFGRSRFQECRQRNEHPHSDADPRRWQETAFVSYIDLSDAETHPWKNWRAEHGRENASS